MSFEQKLPLNRIFCSPQFVEFEVAAAHGSLLIASLLFFLRRQR